MTRLPDEPVEVLVARLPESERTALTAQVGQAVLAASHAAACLARTGRFREATVFQLLGFLAAAQAELHAAAQLVRDQLQATDAQGASDLPTS